MNMIELSFQRKEYPYSDETFDPNIVWGRLKLIIRMARDNNVKELIDLEWDIRPFVEWISRNRERILNDNLEFLHKANGSEESNAKKIHDFYENERLFDETLADKVFEYRESHGLRFALRGTDLEDIYIGLNGNNYEISLYNGINSWEYYVDLPNFIKDIENNYASKLM